MPFLENFLFFRRIFVFGVFLIDQNWKNQVLNIGNCSLSVSPWFPQKISKIYFEISEYINFFQKKKFLQKKSQKNWIFLRYFDSLKKIAKVDVTDEWCILFQKKNQWNEKLSSSRDHRKYYFFHKRENLLRNWFLFFWRQFSFFGENSPKKALTLTVLGNLNSTYHECIHRPFNPLFLGGLPSWHHARRPHSRHESGVNEHRLGNHSRSDSMRVHVVHRL